MKVLGRGLAALVRIDADAHADDKDTIDVTVAVAIERQRIRAMLDADKRPAPGTSELLSRPMAVECSSRLDGGGEFVFYDLVALAPVHLQGGSIDNNKGRRWHPLD